MAGRERRSCSEIVALNQTDGASFSLAGGTRDHRRQRPRASSGSVPACYSLARVPHAPEKYSAVPDCDPNKIRRVLMSRLSNTRWAAEKRWVNRRNIARCVMWSNTLNQNSEKPSPRIKRMLSRVARRTAQRGLTGRQLIGHGSWSRVMARAAAATMTPFTKSPVNRMSRMMSAAATSTGASWHARE